MLPVKNKIETSLSRELAQRAKFDFGMILLVVLIFGSICLGLDIELFEDMYDWSRKYESFELDEIFISILLGAPAVAFFAVRRMQDIKRLNGEISTYAFVDAITGLPNRVLSLDRLNSMLATAQRNGSKVAVIFIDVDDFKKVNDTYGHLAGDQLIRAVGQSLQQRLRGGDTVGRLGGDEFVILMDLDNERELGSALGRLTELQDSRYCIGDNELKAGFSLGVSIYPKDGQSAHELLKFADIAMYRAKGAGKGGLQFYRAEMGTELRARYEIETKLRSAISANELFLEYQAQYDLTGQCCCGYEALVRWRKDGKLVPPLEFIGIAEETGQIEQLGDWVLTTALAESKQFLRPDQTLAINISPKQFANKDFVERIEQEINRFGIDPNQLELEITESSLEENQLDTVEKLQRLRALGISVAVDDFGTGYSSLGRLRSLPISRLKIDRSFIKSLPDDLSDRKLVANIIRLARDLNLDVVAEGVETAAQHQLLMQLNCEAMQGYYYHRPQPLEKVINSGNCCSQYKSVVNL